MSFECSNPLWGTTSNSIDISLSPGGSSGGEAALIASKGSIIGVGRYNFEINLAYLKSLVTSGVAYVFQLISPEFIH